MKKEKKYFLFGNKSTFLTQNILLRAIAGLFSFSTIIIRKNGKIIQSWGETKLKNSKTCQKWAVPILFINCCRKYPK